MISPILGARRSEMPDIESLPILAANRSEILDPLQIALSQDACARQIANHTAGGQHPVIAARHEAGLRNAARGPARRDPKADPPQHTVAPTPAHRTAPTALHHTPP